MEINLKNLSDQKIESSTDSKKMRLSEDASSMVFQLFTKNVYSNPIGTVVREITSNCFDSHTEAGITAPVLIKKHEDKSTGTHYISFIDYGVGMSPDRVENIYGVYFESTKRADNEQIGGFGIGGKTPLAYKRSTGQGEGEYDNSFYVVTVYNKVKYFYCIYEGSESPIISKLHEEPTKEKNGTEIQIPVLLKDMDKFSKELVGQLYYFENIVFQGFDNEYEGDILTNEYQIIRGKNFLFRGEDYNRNMHVCLGRVAYPIDYDTLGLVSDDYRLPIALKLDVGDIGVTVSRESLDYSETTIKMLKKKLETAKNEIIELIGKQYGEVQTLEQYFSVKHDFGKLNFTDDISLYVDNLIKQKDVDFSNFKYQFTKMPNDKQLFNFFFTYNTYGKKPRRSRYSNNSGEFVGGYESLVKDDNLLYFEDNFKRKIIKQAYLKDQHETYHIISKNKIGNWMRSDIADLFNVHVDVIKDDKGKLSPFVQELMEMQDEYFEIVREQAEDYDELVVPEDFIVNRKRGAGITPELRKTSIPVKFVGGYSKNRVKLSALFDYNMPIFYGTVEEEHILMNAVEMYRLLFDSESLVLYVDYNDILTTSGGNGKYKKSIAFVQLAKNNVKHMTHCKDARPIKDFFTYMLPRKTDIVLEYFQTHALVEKYNNIGNFYLKDFINSVDKNWGKKVNIVKNLITAIPKNHKNDDIWYYKNAFDKYFKINDIKQTKEQLEVLNLIEEIQKLEEKNHKTLNFFNLPYYVDDLKKEEITILQLAMDLS